ncbi:MAG: hypothetical protein WDN04_18290 [Rhodospirillales bacterium]
MDAGASLSGSGRIAGALVDLGSVAAVGGTLTLAGKLSGTGTLSAGAGAVLDLTKGGQLRRPDHRRRPGGDRWAQRR